MMIKYPIHKVAKDFKHGSKELPSKEVMDILTQYGHPPKNHMQPLTEQELAIVFEYLTQHNQVESIASIYEDVYHEPSKPAAQQAKRAPAAHQKGGQYAGEADLHNDGDQSVRPLGGQAENAGADDAIHRRRLYRIAPDQEGGEKGNDPEEYEQGGLDPEAAGAAPGIGKIDNHGPIPAGRRPG